MLSEIMQGTKNLCLPQPSLVSLLYVRTFYGKAQSELLLLWILQTAPLSDACNSLASDHCTQPFQAQTLLKADRKVLQFEKFILQQQCAVKQMCWKKPCFLLLSVE